MNPQVLLLATGLFCLSPALPLEGADWLQFRGPAGSGAASPEDAPAPARFADSSIAWKHPLPGRGLSGPIVIGDQVIVTAATGPEQRQLQVRSIDAATGETRWERRFLASGRTMTHDKTNVAAPTPCSDGERIFALFSSNDLFCFNLNGDLLWLRGLTFDYPNASNSLGMAASPVVVGDTLIVQSENDSESFAAGLAVSDGTNRWRLDRPKAANWTSPVVLGEGDAAVVALQSSQGLLGIAPATGSELWAYREGAATIPSATVDGGMIYLPSSGITALRPDGSLVEKRWRNEQARPKTSSPVAARGVIYFPEGGVLTAIQAESGERLWKIRIQGDFSASPVVSGDHLYLFSENGIGQIVPLTGDAEPTVSSIIELGETILSTPAIAGGAIYVRSDGHLWKLVQAEP